MQGFKLIVAQSVVVLLQKYVLHLIVKIHHLKKIMLHQQP